MNGEVETKLVVQALRLNTLSKLTFADSKRFDSIIQDVFPGINFQEVEHTSLKEALKKAMEELKLIHSDVQVRCLPWKNLWNEISNECPFRKIEGLARIRGGPAGLFRDAGFATF